MARRITAQEAAGFVTSGMWIDYGATLCQPDAFDTALAQRKDDLRGVKIRAALTVRPRAVLEADPSGEHFCWINLHFSGYDRRKHDAGIANYLPVNLGEIPDYYRRFIDPVDIVIIKTCPMDENGYFNFSAATLWHKAVIERARMVIVEESSGIPYVMGEQTGVHVRDVDYIINGDNAPATELPNPQPTDVDRAVGRLIAGEIEDGDCLQIGIGGMPNAECCVQLATGEQRAESWHPYRDADRRHHGSLPGRPHYRRPQATEPWQDRFHFRTWLALPV